MTLSGRTPKIHVTIPRTTSSTYQSYYDYSDDTLSQCPTEIDLEGPGPPPPLLSLEADQYVTRIEKIKPSDPEPPKNVWRQISRWLRRVLFPLNQTEVAASS
jgi:hypothetical protein